MTDDVRIHQLFDRAAKAHPDRPAVTDWTGRTLSYGALDQLIVRTIAELAAMGLRPGDRLLIVSENAASLPALLLSASRMDAVAVPVNARMTAPELAKIADHTEPRLTLFLSDVSDPARDHAMAAGARPVELAGGALHVAGPFEVDPEAVEPDARMTAVILYTTGTTGMPKGVMLTHGNLIFGGRSSARLRGIVPTDRIYGVLPMTHVFGLTSMACAGLSSGAHLTLVPRFNAGAVLDALLDGVTVLPAVPQMHAAIMAEARLRGLERLDGPLRYVSSGAAPLDPDWKRRAEDFYGIALQNGYGMTETTAGVTITVNEKGDPDPSAGIPLPGAQIAIDESVGREPGTGEVLTRGPHVMRGYFRNGQATAQVLSADGWMRTGDLGRMDPQGRLHIVGRCKELIIRGGFNVYPPEVEAALNDHPAVLQAAVIGRRRDGGDEDILAFCQLSGASPVTEAQLAEHAAARLSPYKRPSRILICGPLPAAATGKILKHRLIEHFADLLATPEDAATGG
ncbi:class I adenylate-forming enzyme family protein [Paracoccus sp. 1_MG-2023]|uniref:class I adenylate-forming enzyme family protein n=1 Tax=unclassified Paracoccus (in: a-proteobacteria) TaxID=2688777 RepID=UPI001C0A5CFF|nr:MULTISPECIES: class I adenylate-forming enzyme family protein [unclassified Paracoccus (in: a-proteobacteria)]MBU2956909.1 acyl--CoA ligase [Paracoccus sp. C2R09]MDO6668107.1 class I adenylate-forming enzyme family protein [Paracoccus sp. 1_MG-2023]